MHMDLNQQKYHVTDGQFVVLERLGGFRSGPLPEVRVLYPSGFEEIFQWELFENRLRFHPFNLEPLSRGHMNVLGYLADYRKINITFPGGTIRVAMMTPVGKEIYS